mgnify:CR=1 FL=1
MALRQMVEDDVQLIESRVEKNKERLPTDAISLFVSNKEVQDHNNERLEQIATQQFIRRI